jgi:hypothetical protein
VNTRDQLEQAATRTREEIEHISQRLAELFGQLAEWDPDTDPGGSGRDELGRQVNRLNAERFALSDQLRELDGQLGRPWPVIQLSPDQQQRIELQRRLVEIADAQIATVRAWNRHPAVELQAEFIEKMRELSDKFGEIRARLRSLEGDSNTDDDTQVDTEDSG